ncbi:MAG: spore coat protein [candidate division Zixibacteria bacterium]|nr:spore coat protein [candidate division Zixibacteria bacterium]
MKKYFIFTLSIISILMLSCSKNSNITSTQEIDIPDWSTSTHSNSTEPNYEEVFGEGIVRRIDIIIPSDNWQSMLDDMTANYGTFGRGSHGPPPNSGNNPVWVSSSILYNSIEWYKVGVRFKGNSSLMSTWSSGIGKLSFKLDFDQFEDSYPQIENQRFYGFKQLNLGNGFEDNSLIREKAASDIFREAGIPVAHTAFYRVYVDNGNGPIYFGLYTMIEEVDDTVIDDQFEDDDGNLYKPEGNGATFAEGTFNESEFEKKSNESSDWSDVQELFSVLHSDLRNSNAIDRWKWIDMLDGVLDTDEFVKWLAVNTVMQNWDTYGKMSHNYYLYHNPIDDLFKWIPWDNNEAIEEGKQGGALSISLTETSNTWPLIRYLLDNEFYQLKYVAYVEETINGAFEPSKMIARYQELRNLVEPYVIGDDGEIDGHTFLSSSSDFAAEHAYLISHVSNRNAVAQEYIQTQ